MDFETSVKRLEEITSALEKENISLEEALKLYEEGVRLVRACNERVEDAERRIRILKMTRGISSARRAYARATRASRRGSLSP